MSTKNVKLENSENIIIGPEFVQFEIEKTGLKYTQDTDWKG